MEKIIFGLLLTIIGLKYSIFCLAYAALESIVYFNLNGLWDALLERNTMILFLVSCAIMLLGLGICFRQAFKKER